MAASRLTEEIGDTAPLTDVVKGHMDSQSGENSSIRSSKVSCLDGDPMSVILFSKQSLGLTQKAMTRLSALQLLLNQLVASNVFQPREEWLGGGYRWI
jgi:hypothetical protein